MGVAALRRRKQPLPRRIYSPVSATSRLARDVNSLRPASKKYKRAEAPSPSGLPSMQDQDGGRRSLRSRIKREKNEAESQENPFLAGNSEAVRFLSWGAVGISISKQELGCRERLALAGGLG